MNVKSFPLFVSLLLTNFNITKYKSLDSFIIIKILFHHIHPILLQLSSPLKTATR